MYYNEIYNAPTLQFTLPKIICEKLNNENLYLKNLIFQAKFKGKSIGGKKYIYRPENHQLKSIEIRTKKKLFKKKTLSLHSKFLKPQ